MKCWALMPLRELAIDASRMSAAEKTGTEWYSLEIIQALAALRPRPRLTLYLRSGQPPRAGPGLRSRTVQPPRLWTHLGLSAAMARDRPNALFVPAHVIPLVHPRASVVTVHDLGYLAEPESHTRRRRRLLELTTRWNARAARRVIAISEQTKADIVAHYGTQAGKIDVVPHGVDLARFRPRAAAEVQPALAELGVQPPYLFFLSTLQPRKNLIRLIAAFEGLEADDLTLVLAGRPGWLAEPIEQRIAASPARSRIQRLGHVPDALVPALYNGAAVFVLPSLYEGFGMGVLEAMASGCPVVTSNRSSLPEVAGDAAVLVEPLEADSIRAGIAHALQPERRAALIQAGLDRAAGFTWERAARQTLSSICHAYDDAHG